MVHGASRETCRPDPARGPDLYPSGLHERIDALNARICETVNDGVYRAGFATSQEAYEAAFDALFESLDTRVIVA
jgi:putative glutathione S-transferase